MKRALTALLSLAVVATVVRAAAPEKPYTDEQKLAVLLEMIRAAEDIPTASAAFTRSRSIDAAHVPILTAYLDTTLRLGRTDLALFPARLLTGMNVQNGTAWGVLSYAAAQDGKLAEALAYGVRAVNEKSDDVGLVRNAGQLLAWYDVQPMPPELSNDTRRLIVRVRALLAEKAAFKTSYDAATELFKNQEQVGQEALAKALPLQQRHSALQEKVFAIDAELRAMSAEIDRHEDIIRSLREELRLSMNYPTRISTYYQPGQYTGLRGGFVYNGGSLVVGGSVGGQVVGGRTVVVDRGGFYDSYQAGRYRRGEIYAAIRDEQSAIDGLEGRRNALREQGMALLPEWRRLGEQIDRLREASDKADEAVRRRFAWEPPAGGAQQAPIGPVNADLAGKPVKIEFPPDPEEDARRHLNLAELYYRNGLLQKAAEHARIVVDKYPSTKSATPAARLLGVVSVK